jgi:cytochrome c553
MPNRMLDTIHRRSGHRSEPAARSRTLKGLGAGPFLALGLLTISTAVSNDGAAQFERSVRPVLVERCFSCHSAKGKVRGGLQLDSRAAILAGGDSGPAVDLDQPEKSLLLEMVSPSRPEHPDPAAADRLEPAAMPPQGKKLTESERAALARWIKEGLPFPGAEADAPAATKGVNSGNGADAGSKELSAAGPPIRTTKGVVPADRNYWFFQRPVEPKVPAGGTLAGWGANELDRFVAARLEAAGLTPAPEADRLTLIRRVTFDLTGLPPTVAEIDAFVADESPDAWLNVVRRLLASPRYGERQARRWFDLVRYAESDGFREDAYRPDAWRYRDYVIDSFQRDKPWARFVQEQLAGDELFPGDPAALVATGFYRHTMYEWNQADVRTQWTDMLTDVTDTVADVFLGVGLQCARCHDHKYDPLLQEDYFRLQAFFAPMQPANPVVATDVQRRDHERKRRDWEAATAAIRAEMAGLLDESREKAADGAIERFPKDIQAMVRKPESQRTPLERQLAALAMRQVDRARDEPQLRLKGEDRKKYLALAEKLKQFDHLKPGKLPTVMASVDVGPTPPPTLIPGRKRGANVEPALLAVLGGGSVPITPTAVSTGRRAALARWMTAPDNPMAARVAVNRIWQDHFGRGLVATASDFGRLGGNPSHPELLDWLAVRFVREGWSLKKLHELILTSSTWRQRSDVDPALVARDPENRLLSRFTPRRLEAEEVRDGILFVAGRLDLASGGPGDDPERGRRRTVHSKQLRNRRPPLLDAFDLPTGMRSCACRNSTSTPIQSLVMLNGDFTLEHAAGFADRVLALPARNEADRIRAAARLALGREPDSARVTLLEEFLRRQIARTLAEKTGAADRVASQAERSAAGDSVVAAGRVGESALKSPSSGSSGAGSTSAGGAATPNGYASPKAEPKRAIPPPADARVAAWRDLAQLLLISNDFVHVD